MSTLVNIRLKIDGTAYAIKDKINWYMKSSGHLDNVTEDTKVTKYSVSVGPPIVGG